MESVRKTKVNIEPRNCIEEFILHSQIYFAKISTLSTQQHGLHRDD